MRGWTVVAVLLSAGCIEGVGSEEAELGVGLEALGDAAEPLLLLRNDGPSPITVGCDNGWYCARSVRVDAMQIDGRWVEAAAWVEQPTTTIVRPGGTLPIDGVRFGFEPGTYRIVVPFADAGADDDDATGLAARELTVTGWAPEVVDAAMDVRRRSEDASCRGLTRRVFTEVRSAAEPDALADLHRRAEEREREVLLNDLLERGVFVDYLATELSLGSMDEVRRAADWLVNRRRTVQAPLRDVVTERLVAQLDDLDAEIPLDDYWNIEQLDDHWPAGTAEALILRLQRTDESGEHFAALVDVFGYAGRARFEGHEPYVYDLLRRRCAGQTDEAVVDACDSAIAAFEPSMFPGIGLRGRGTSVGCGGVLYGHRSETCRALDDEWTELRQTHGPVELVWH